MTHKTFFVVVNWPLTSTLTSFCMNNFTTTEGSVVDTLRYQNFFWQHQASVKQLCNVNDKVYRPFVVGVVQTVSFLLWQHVIRKFWLTYEIFFVWVNWSLTLHIDQLRMSNHNSNRSLWWWYEKFLFVIANWSFAIHIDKAFFFLR